VEIVIYTVKKISGGMFFSGSILVASQELLKLRQNISESIPIRNPFPL